MTSQDTLTYFQNIPQCATLLSQPGVQIGGALRPATTTLNPLIDETLRLNDGITRTMYFTLPEPEPRTASASASTSASNSNDTKPRRAYQFLQLGRGVMGQPGMVHGAFQSALMDNLTGTLIAMTGIDRDRGMLTLGLNISFKRPIPLPAVVVAKAWLERVEGRKMWIGASVEDLDGGVSNTAEAMWIVRRDKL